ncbi:MULTISPECIES: hypothetical protein [Rhizobium/Agrobacterium group]|uniref:hypothetical protein n=1 Tax=Rhizobium/Agrobacterium group TaxID=227290 RepID=UPI001113312D|nr:MULTISPECIES: hypothetical protein [Rhizobium/Agrobacterium group]MUO27182.1 hypothetical protein [Agrobacterium vitis]
MVDFVWLMLRGLMVWLIRIGDASKGVRRVVVAAYVLSFIATALIGVNSTINIGMRLFDLASEY